MTRRPRASGGARQRLRDEEARAVRWKASGLQALLGAAAFADIDTALLGALLAMTKTNTAKATRFAHLSAMALAGTAVLCNLG